MALTDKLSAIGNAIREKTGGSAKLTLDEMPNAIASISGEGGSTVVVNQSVYTGQVQSNYALNFYNFADGSTLLDHSKITVVFGVIEGNNTVIYKFRTGYGDSVSPLTILANSTQPAKNINVNVFDTNGQGCDWSLRYSNVTIDSSRITFAFLDGRVMSPVVIPMIMFEE